MTDATARECAPAAERNKDPILAVLRGALPSRGLVLEVASGTGQHIAHFAAALPTIFFQPTEADEARHPSIRAWTVGLENVAPPQAIDVTAVDWGVPRADAILAINLIHIAPWEATIGLFAGAARLLPPGGLLLLYGPFKQGGRHTAKSNALFDQSLRARDLRWGVRDLDDVREAALRKHLSMETAIPMPANNLCVLFRRD